MSEFATKLLDTVTGWLVDAPKNAVFESRTWDFREPLAWWLTTIIISIMVLTVLFLYILERGTLGWVRRIVLVGIRSSLLVLVLLLIFRPVLFVAYKGERTRHIVVLLDSSQSMKQKDRRVSDEDILRVAIARGFEPLTTKIEKIDPSKILQLKSRADMPKDPSRVDMVKWMLGRNDLDLIENLEKKGKLQAWTFGSRLLGLSEQSDPLPDAVLKKLAALKDKDFESKELFVDELSKQLKDDDLQKYQERIVDRASGMKYKLTQKALNLLGSTSVNAQLLANLKPSDDSTSLYDSINAILQRKDDDLPAAIFIITDGQDNASKLKRSDITPLCKQFQVPLYVYGVGSAQAAALQLKEVIVQDTLFVSSSKTSKDTVKIPVSWKSRGLDKGNVEISVQMGKKVPGKTPGSFDWQYEKIKLKDKDDKDIDKRTHKVADGLFQDYLTFPVREKPGLKPDEIQDEIQKLKITLQLTDNILFEDDKGQPILSESFEREVRVTNRKIKVLVIENSPRFEFKFLQTALDPEREPRFETTYYLANADEKVTRPNLKATPDEIRRRPFIRKLPDRKEFFDAKFDVVLLGDVAPEPDLANKLPGLGKPQMEYLKEFVEKFRGGLIFVAGRQNMPVKYKNKDFGLIKDKDKENPLAELLPIEFEGKLGLEESPLEYKPTLTDVGQRTEMLFLADTPEENLKLWEKLPGFFWQFPITKLRAGATALVVNPRVKIPGTEQSMPVIVTQLYGKGQVLYCGTDETWRWRENVGDKHFVRYWGQILYHMGLPHLLAEGSKRVVFSQDQSEFLLDKQSYLYVRVFDKDFNPRKDAQLEGTLEQVDVEQGPRVASKKVIFQQATGFDGKPLPGEYKVLLPNKDKGKFQIKLTSLGDDNPGEPFIYRVETPPRHELDEMGLAEKDLRDLAKDSGGKFYREEDLHHLASDVSERKVDFHIRQEVVLWNWLVMAIFITLISTEWLIRKFSNLS